MNSWTFGICTDGNSPYLDRIEESIAALGLPEYEIMYATEHFDFHRRRTVYIGNERPKWITRKKNRIAQHARYPNLCLLHDYAAVESFTWSSDEWDVACMKVLMPDGQRHWDWCTNEAGEAVLLSYEDQSHKHQQYVSGTAFCVKRDFLRANPFNEALVWSEGEDSEWSSRIRDRWRLELNLGAVIHLLRFPSQRSKE